MSTTLAYCADDVHLLTTLAYWNENVHFSTFIVLSDILYCIECVCVVRGSNLERYQDQLSRLHNVVMIKIECIDSAGERLSHHCPCSSPAPFMAHLYPSPSPPPPPQRLLWPQLSVTSQFNWDVPTAIVMCWPTWTTQVVSSLGWWLDCCFFWASGCK